MASKVLLIFGAGARVGGCTVRKFASEGWSVAAVSRTIRDEVKSHAALTFENDHSDPTSIKAIFDKVEQELGAPSAVIYNAASAQMTSGDEPFSVPLEDWLRCAHININTPYAAAQAALSCFAKLPADVPKTFAFTGNATIHQVWPVALTLGVGKSGTAHMIETGAVAYRGRSRWYFVDERTADGKPHAAIDGPAHADVFFELATEGDQEAAQRSWEVNFVVGQGYRHFGSDLGGWDGTL